MNVPIITDIFLFLIMNNINTIEDSLNKASEVYFHLTDNYNKEPSSIKLGFTNPQDGIIGYKGISVVFKDFETTVIIFKNSNNILSLSIVSKQTANTLNIKNVKYDDNNLSLFLKNEPKNQSICLLIGPVPASGYDVVFPEGIVTPLVIGSHDIVHLP